MMEPDHAPSPKEIGEHYDSLSEFYRDAWGDALHHGYWIKSSDSTETAIRNLGTAVADLATISGGDRVLDIGSGYGATAIRLAVERGASVTGWTVSRDQFAVSTEAAARLPDTVEKPTFHCRDWLESEITTGSCDAVIAIECLSHIHRKDEFFQKVVDGLRPGGRLVIADWATPPHPSSWQRRWLLDPIAVEGRLASLAGIEELTLLANKAGLELLETREISSRVRKTWRVITARLVGKFLKDSRYRHFFLENLHDDRIFAVTIARLLFAYHTGALQYGLLGFEKPDSSPCSAANP